METEVLNAVNLLIKEGYVIPYTVDDGQGTPSLSVTSKLNRFLQDQKTQKPAATSIGRKQEKMGIREFRDLAEIPTQIKTKNFTYNANRISIQAEKEFNRVIGLVDPTLFVEATKAYYKDVNASRVTLSGYLVDGIWEGVYKDFTAKPKVANPKFTGDRSI